MAIIKCTECGKEISDKAYSCPHCGCPVDIKGIEDATRKINDIQNGNIQNKDIIYKINGENVNMSELWRKSATKEDMEKKISRKCRIKKNEAKEFSERFIKESGENPNKGCLTGCFSVFFAIFLILILGKCNSDTNPAKIDEKTEIEITTTETTTTETTTTETTTTETTTEEVESEEEYRESCEEYNYKDVLRNPEDYIGKRIKIKLKISSVHEESILNSTKYYFAYSESDYGWYGDYYAIFDERAVQEPKLLSEDIIEVYGEIAESEYTKSLILSSQEVFAIKMKYADLIEE